MRPDVWAPAAEQVEVVLGDGRRVPLQPGGDGWFVGGPTLGAGERYGFSLDGGAALPDPRSRWQPDGVHGLSAVDDPSLHDWADEGWSGVELPGNVIYELHIGTFTPGGTLDSAVERLDHLVELGIGAVELMPVAEAMGERGWGYDGVDLWAVHHAYGGPAALRRFVDAAHARGLGVLLDVVYNHLGPEGGYLNRFGPYFTDRHQTPWGPAVNLDGPGSAEVRRFIVDNARHWCEDHHLDGLRLDAVHALVDDRPTHVVAELVATLHELGERTGVRRWVVIEHEDPDPQPLRQPHDGGWGVDARWGDDLHHALHGALTGERDGYYAPFGRLAHVAQVLRHGHLPPTPPLPSDLDRRQLVTCAQNHDQIGNRPGGERLAQLTGLAPAMAAAAVVLLGPGTPLLFQGEEWGATATFPFFCDTDDADLAQRIRTGRLTELEPLGWDADSYLDPLDPDVAALACLDWDELSDPTHRTVLDWYRGLIALRRHEPAVAAGSEVVVDVDEVRRTLVLRRGPVVLVANLGPHPVDVPGFHGAELVAAFGDAALTDRGRLEVPAGTTAVVRLAASGADQPGRTAAFTQRAIATIDTGTA